jgi:hypothetical protein
MEEIEEELLWIYQESRPAFDYYALKLDALIEQELESIPPPYRTVSTII